MPSMHHDDLRPIFDAHDAALRELRAASRAFDQTIAGLRTVLDAVAAANHAQGAAIDAVVAANQAALKLLREGEGDPPR